MSIQVTPIPRLTSFAAPALTLGTTNAAGTADTTIATDSTILAFDTTLPAAVGTAAVGSATVAPRRDHVHGGTTLAAPALTLGTSNAAGSAATVIATDSTLLAFDTTLPAPIGTSATGVATVTARRDHVHSGPPVDRIAYGEFTKDTSDANGTTTVISGLGFTVKSIIFFYGGSNEVGRAGWGMADSSSQGALMDAYEEAANKYFIPAAYTGSAIATIQSGTKVYEGEVTTFGTDGYTVTWDAPSTACSGTLTVIYMAFGEE